MSEENNWNFLDILDPSSASSDFVLLILNQPIVADTNLVTALWKRASLRISVDGGSNRWLEFMESNRLESLPSPDYITGDFDSITDRTKKYFEERNVQFICTPDQDETDYTKALRHARSVIDERHLQVRCVVALCDSSGRLDQIMANLETLYHAQGILDVPVVSLASDSATWVLAPGKHLIRVKQEYIEQKFWCGLIPLSGSTVVTTEGLKWNLENGVLAFGQLVSTSNTFVSTNVRIICDKNLVWTMQYRET